MWIVVHRLCSLSLKDPPYNVRYVVAPMPELIAKITLIVCASNFVVCAQNFSPKINSVFWGGCGHGDLYFATNHFFNSEHVNRLCTHFWVRADSHLKMLLPVRGCLSPLIPKIDYKTHINRLCMHVCAKFGCLYTKFSLEIREFVFMEGLCTW